MTNAATADKYIGRRAVDPQGNKIGSVGQVYLDDNTGQPDWVTVNTGLFGLPSTSSVTSKCALPGPIQSAGSWKFRLWVSLSRLALRSVDWSTIRSR